MIDPRDISKPNLIKEFSKNYKEHYKVELFEKEGFSRHTCRICEKNFWSIEDRETCEDSDHNEYRFFKDRPVKMGYVEFWKKFADFFKKNGHEVVDRYPVVSRWRQDLYFTIASIQDFQRIEGGRINFEYNANPLIVPQMCLRFVDIENVGLTGRHFSGFMMAGQHAFNYPKEGYWKDRTIELNFGLLTSVLGIKKEDIVYNEDVWAMPDFSGFGPSLESFSKGVELVNSVFTQFQLSNGKINELDSKIVDVGWGFDRLLWYYTGAEDAYDAVFSSVLEKVKKKTSVDIDTKLLRKFSKFAGELNMEETEHVKEKQKEILSKAGVTESEYETKIKPTQAMYAILDHTRTLMFAINDGALPSNIGGGYNLRIILRRALDFIEKYKFNLDIVEVAHMEAEDLKGLYPELLEGLKTGSFAEIVEIESKRYSKSKENASKVVEAIINKGENIDTKRLTTLYESNGVTPEFIKAVAAQKKVHIDLPDTLYADMIVGDMVKKEKTKGAEVEIPESVPETKQLYYDFKSTSKSKVLFAKGKYVVLDKTPFYPEGGGQAPDLGTIGGIKVTDVQKYNGIIVHTMEKQVDGIKALSKGSLVDAEVDLDRRFRLIAHHTATHLMSAASRQLLGKHAWQEGARKDPDKAHIDIAHFERLSDEQLTKLEDLVNGWLRNGIKVDAKIMDRNAAEGKYGFEIYQGHGVPSKKMRIILIESKEGRFIDAEACGGLHAVNQEHLVGIVKIINSYRLHDGIDRIEYVAGEAALDYFRKVSTELSASAVRLSSDMFKVAEKVAMLDEENRKAKKQLQDSKESMASHMASTLSGSGKIEKEVDAPRAMLRIMATKAVAANNSAVALIWNKEGEIVCVAGAKSGANALELIKKKAGSKKFVGGGSAKFAEGKIV